MRIRAYILFVAITTVFVATVCLPPLASAATKSVQKEYGEPKDDKALAYFIRTKRFVSAVVPFFLYAGDEFLGVLAGRHRQSRPLADARRDLDPAEEALVPRHR